MAEAAANETANNASTTVSSPAPSQDSQEGDELQDGTMIEVVAADGFRMKARNENVLFVCRVVLKAD